MTDRQLTAAQGGLGCLAVPNPNNPKHGDMKLYMRAQVEAGRLPKLEFITASSPQSSGLGQQEVQDAASSAAATRAGRSSMASSMASRRLQVYG